MTSGAHVLTSKHTSNAKRFSDRGGPGPRLGIRRPGEFAVGPSPPGYDSVIAMWQGREGGWLIQFIPPIRPRHRTSPNHKALILLNLNGEPGGARTRDHRIKSATGFPSVQFHAQTTGVWPLPSAPGCTGCSPSGTRLGVRQSGKRVPLLGSACQSSTYCTTEPDGVGRTSSRGKRR